MIVKTSTDAMDAAQKAGARIGMYEEFESESEVEELVGKLNSESPHTFIIQKRDPRATDTSYDKMLKVMRGD